MVKCTASCDIDKTKELVAFVVMVFYYTSQLHGFLISKINRIVLLPQHGRHGVQSYAYSYSVTQAPDYSMLPHSGVEYVLPPYSKLHICVDPVVINDTQW